MSTFHVVPGESSVETEVRSSLHPIHGKADDLSGAIDAEFDGEGSLRLDLPHAGWVELPVEAIRSGNRLNDAEMRRRAEAGRYPTVRFEVKRVWAVDGTRRLRGAFDVTAHGRTHGFEEDFTATLDGGRLVLQGEHVFDMRDFGVDPPRILTLKVEPQVRVRVRVVAEER